jgi:hypothetical protein
MRQGVRQVAHPLAQRKSVSLLTFLALRQANLVYTEMGVINTVGRSHVRRINVKQAATQDTDMLDVDTQNIFFYHLLTPRLLRPLYFFQNLFASRPYDGVY